MTKNALLTLTRFTVLISRNVNVKKVTLADLSDVEKKLYKALIFDYKKQFSIYKQKKIVLLNLCLFIQKTISCNNLIYTFKCETAYDMLIALKDHVALSDQA